MYDYAALRPQIFTEDGMRMFLKIRDKTKSLLDASGAARLQEMITGVCGDEWIMLACVDYLVELREIREVTTPGSVAGQHRIFVRV